MIKDQDLERLMGGLLRVGVIVAAIFVAIGGTLYLFRHGHSGPQYKTFQGEPEDLTNLLQIFSGLLSLHSRAMIQFGLLVLIATPVARVVFSIVGFALEKDYTYVLISVLVLAIIVFSMITGLES